MPAHASAAAAERSTKRIDGGRADIGQFGALHVPPDRFDGIQLGGVARQSFHGQPGVLPGEIRAHHAVAVRGKSVPDEDHWAAEVPLERSEKGDQRPVGIGAGLSLEEEARAASIPSEGQGGGDGQALPRVAHVPQDQGLAARRPRAADDRLLREPAFVLEDEPRSSRRAFFLAAATASLSTARSPPRRVRGLAALAAARTSRAVGATATRGPDGAGRR